MVKIFIHFFANTESLVTIKAKQITKKIIMTDIIYFSYKSKLCTIYLLVVCLLLISINPRPPQTSRLLINLLQSIHISSRN